MATRRSKLLFTIVRAKRFWDEFRRNRRALVGLLIILFYVGLALAAPLLTPYDPTHRPDWYLAGRLATPEWWLPLTQGPLSKNLRVSDSFSTSTNFWEWGFETTSNQGCFAQHAPSIGESGSAAIIYDRGRNQESKGEVQAYFTEVFHYPYEGHPQRFNIKIKVLVEGTSSAKTGEIDVPVEISILLKRLAENKTETYYMPARLPEEIFVAESISISSTSKWLSILSDSIEIKPQLKWPTIERDIFSKAGDYILGVKITFNDHAPTSNNSLQTTVFIDSIRMKCFGTAFGLLGTDYVGRDIFTQFVYGARISLFVGLLSAIISVSCGLIVGLVSGFMRGFVDEILMRFNDMLLVLPGLPLLIVLMAVLGPSVINIVLLIGFLGWMGFARVVRAQTLSLRERPFVEATKALGGGTFYVIRRHIIPNVMALVYVTLATSVPGAIVAEASLSWLGLFDPHRMSWGRMLHDIHATPGSEMNLWWMLPPGLSIAALSAAFILIGYALDEILNPRLRQRR